MDKSHVPHILVVEDADDTLLLIKAALGNSFRITCAKTAEDGLRKLREIKDIGLVLMDVSLPDGDGFSLCAMLREDETLAHVPVFFVTGRTKVSDKVLGFSIGGDDYISKPFEPAELKARVQARFARQRRQAGVAEFIRRGALVIDLAMQDAFLEQDGQRTRLNLTPLEFKILSLLAKREDVVLSRNQILSYAWGPNVFVLDRTIDKHVCSLRAKLKSAGDSIETVVGAGYRFVLKKKAA